MTSMDFTHTRALWHAKMHTQAVSEALVDRVNCEHLT